ncbi:MarR family winged helix-turn-helix transcriptional regulator [Sphingomonas mollis]
MTATIVPPAELFLRETAIRGGMDLMFFAHSRHLRRADDELARVGLGRAHHRVLYFVARKPDMTVGELLTILAIAKQSLARVARELTEKGLLTQRPGVRDRRQRLIALTPAGEALERELFTLLRSNMADAYAASGGTAVTGFWTVMQNLMGEEARLLFSALHRNDPLPATGARSVARAGADA